MSTPNMVRLAPSYPFDAMLWRAGHHFAAFCMFLACVMSAGRLAAADDQTARADWPVYRHDAALSGVTPAVGRIDRPEVLTEYYLGAPYQLLVTTGHAGPANVADLDGDGSQERFSISEQTIRVADSEGRELWSHRVDERLAGSIVRVCRLFPERQDRQIVVFSRRMDTGDGRGYCFSFERGARQGRLAWTTGPLSGYHGPTLIVDDVDGDGVPEIVTAPHYRVQIFDGQTGVLEAEVPWKVGRNYGILLSRARPNAQHKDLFIVCDFVLHVDCIRFQDGKWTHAWGHKYTEPNAPAPRGRQKYLRVGPNPIADLDGDGLDEMAYMVVDGTADDTWHLRVRDCRNGQVRADIANIWVWSIVDLDGDGRSEVIYTPTERKRPPTICDLHVGQFATARLDDLFVASGVRPLLTQVTLPAEAHSIADEGLHDLVHHDVDDDGTVELLVGRPAAGTKFCDSLQAIGYSDAGNPQPVWSYQDPGHRLNMVRARRDAEGRISFALRDLTENQLITVDALGKVRSRADLGQPGGFSTLPIVADLDADGRHEIVLQNAASEIVALAVGDKPGQQPRVLWSQPGVAMNRSPGYSRNGTLCPQAADLDGDGRAEVLFAVEDAAGLAALRCVDGSGKVRWTRSFPGCSWGGLQAGVNLWTFGRFGGAPGGRDVYVDVHRRAKASSEGWVLDGTSGQPLWNQAGLIADGAAMPFGGGMPAVADLNADGIDDLVQEFWTIYGAVSGHSGEPLYPPAPLPGADYFGRWIAYSWPTVADLNADGRHEVYLNSASYARGGYAAVHADGKPMWVEFHDNTQGSNGFGPVGDFDADGKLEIGVGVLDGTLLCLNAADGSHKWTVEAAVAGDIVAGDVNQDGVMEFVFGGTDGRIHARSGRDGRAVWSVAASGTPIIADVDGDSWAEVLVVGHDGKLRIIGQAQQTPRGE